MKRLLFLMLTVTALLSCNEKTNWPFKNPTIIIDSINTFDTIYIQKPNVLDSNGINDKTGNSTQLQGIKIGDKVIVETCNGNQRVGILKAEYQGHYWVNIFNSDDDERGWRTAYPGILPYNKKWEIKY